MNSRAADAVESDVIIVGGGLVGAACALRLAAQGLQISVLSADRPNAPTPEFDARIYAISPCSRELLDAIGVWSLLPPDRVEPVHGMSVAGDGVGSALAFDAIESGVEALAYIVDGGALTRALWDRLSASADIKVFCPARPRQLVIDDDVAWVTSDSVALRAPLVVGADGAASWTRDAAGIKTRERKYRQRGVVANFACGVHHENVARQWFRADGVLALLPLPLQHVSMVWSANEDKAAELMQMTGPELSQVVGQASGNVLGELNLLGVPASFPLRAMTATRFVEMRVALMGDAAHNLHPLAGQGVNLGFRDVKELAHVLQTRGPESDLGVISLLRRYERARREDAAVMLMVTDGLQRLFGSALPGIAWLRNTGLEITGRIPLLKQALVQRVLS